MKKEHFAYVIDPDGGDDTITCWDPADSPARIRLDAHQLVANLGAGYNSHRLGRYVVHHGNPPYVEEVNHYAGQLWTGLAGGGPVPVLRGTVLVTGRKLRDGTHRLLGLPEIEHLAALAQEPTQWLEPEGLVVSAAQAQGDRARQCDAFAVHRDQGTGIWAFAVCDGIGDSQDTADFVQHFTPRLAKAAATLQRPEKAIEAIREEVEPWQRQRGVGEDVSSTAVVVTWHEQRRRTSIAWAGDSRAYMLKGGEQGRLLTVDHNLAQQHRAAGGLVGPYDHNRLTSDLSWGEIGTLTQHRKLDRLLLCTDGAYFPLGDGKGPDLPQTADYYDRNYVDRYWAKSAAGWVVSRAVERHRAGEGGPADNATVLVIAFPDR
ncbi:PP2C family serine/threonine-protein phosphatase [Kitasatospora cheerisanensis]|uniref:PPM-type phosphatase domain-containing protein n=1 Tax=Kitasatospora cheerisanensis KCTC 2395 TaxID=1348663 RepID=A0A066Z6D9_9ACTN|nr:PP2C family protein-serine/threonine phosphatase [Kitasatospora cheerisanensis]KDN85700.1 hypothetical protein KCH_25280 [Kitasatospora cheerisanensis KCTC 2395]